MRRTLTALTLFGLSIAGPSAVRADRVSTTVNLTGCLEKGEGAHEYAIRSDDGKTYDLPKSDVRLRHHVGQEVMLTGQKLKEKRNSNAADNGDLRVTQVKNLKMVSSSCK